MAYTTGTVTSFEGASGMLQTLLNFILGTEVTGESLSGSGTSWSGSLANTPVGLGRLVINYTISAVDYEGVDDGSGNITGTNITAGSITYSSGAYSITFSSSPTGTPTADYIYGDPGQDWRELENRNTRDDGSIGDYDEPFGSDCKEVVISNTGLSGQETIIIGIRETRYSGGSYYAWNLNLYTTYNVGAEWNQSSINHGLTYYNDTYETFTRHPSIPFLDDTMSYWFYSNQQRIIVVAKVASNYESCYLGFGRRFGNPGDYPYPYFLAGSSVSTSNSATTGSYHEFIIMNSAADNNVQSIIMTPGSDFLMWNGSWGTADAFYLLPMFYFYNGGTVNPAKTNQRIMTPVYAVSKTTNRNSCYFDLDGVYHIMGAGLQSEDLVNYGGKRHRIFQNIYRTTYYDYMAIEEGAAVSTTTTTTTTSTTTTTT